MNEIGSSKVKNGMVRTADDASYLAPAENFNNQHEWKDNSVGLSAYVQRPPGMGFLHWIAIKISPNHDAAIHKVLHLMIHFLGLLLFGLVAHRIFIFRLAFFIHLIYATLPCFFGYLFYYLTESITPAILMALLWGFIEFKRNPTGKWILIQSIFVGVLLLVRPQLLIFSIPLMYCVWLYMRKSAKHNWPIIAMAIIIAFGGFAMWQMRTISIVGRWNGIHPIYHTTNQSIFRPVHRSFGELYKIWECKSERFHSHMLRIWNMDETTDSSQINHHIAVITSEIPEKIKTEMGVEKLNHLYYQFHLVSLEVKSGYYHIESNKEMTLRKQIDDYTASLKKKFWVDNYLITPVHSAKYLVTKSQLNLDIFQHYLRGKWWMEGIRYLCVFLIISSLLLTLMGLVKFHNEVYYLFGVSIYFYLGYLFFIQKMNEERYLIPLLPIILLLGFKTFFTKGKWMFSS